MSRTPPNFSSTGVPRSGVHNTGIPRIPTSIAPTSLPNQTATPLQRGVPAPDLIPVPNTPSEVILREIEESGYQLPQKCINTSNDLESFTVRSRAYIRIRRLLQLLPLRVTLKKLPETTSDKKTNNLLTALSRVDTIVDSVPPLEGPRRFGNMAFRTFHDRLEEQAHTALLETIGYPNDSITKETLDKHAGLPSSKTDPYTELVSYFVGSFGSRQRLDYGTGHELSFLAFFGALWSIDLLPEDISGEDILLIFETYFKIIRKLILRYNLEPAGSHGVWGLDDHFHLPYILGSAQIVDITQPDTPTPRFPPRCVLRPHVVEREKSTNIYFSAIAFINEVKRGNFHEHSPILHDITSVSTWHKIHRGMLKMYVAEVLGKFPVVQHFVFGSGFYPWVDNVTGELLPSDDIEETDTNESKTSASIHLLNSQYMKGAESRGKSQDGAKPMPPTKAPWA